MSALRPNSNKGHDLGSSTKKWNELHIGDVLAETVTTSGNVEIGGNLTVTGTQTVLTVATVEATDPLIKLAKDNSADTIDIGFYGLSNDGSDKYHGMFRDADDGKFYLFKDLGTEPSSTVPTLSAGNKATIVANIEGDITGDMTGNADTASAWASSRTVEFTGGDVTGSFSIDGSTDVSSIALTIQSNSVENGMIQNPGLLVGQSGGTPAIINLGNSLEIGGTANEVEVSYSPGEFTIGLPSSISGLTSVSATGFTGALTGNASTASALETARTIQISGDVAGSASFDGSASINIAATIQGSSVDNSMLANNGLDVYVGGVSQERVELGDKLDFVAGQDLDVSYNASSNAITFALEAEIDSDTTGNAATATALETARNFSITGSEVTAAAVSFDATGNVALSAAITSASVANSKLVNSDIGFGNGVASSDIALGGDVVIQGTTSEVEVGYSAGTFTLGLPDTIIADVQGNADSATALETARNFSIGSGPVQAAAVSFDGTGAVSLTTTIADDQITNDMLANDKLVIQVDGVDHDRALGSTLKFAKGGDLEINYSASENEITYTLPSILTADTTGNAATATALETARNFSIGSGPVQATAVSFDGTGAVSLTSSIADDQITNAMLANPGLEIKLAGVSQETIELGDFLDFSGTANQVAIAYDSANNDLTFSLPSEIDVDTSGNAASATILETSRDIQLTGDVVGSASFNGSANASISTTIANGAVDNVMLANSSFTVSDTSNSEAISLGDTLFFGGTSAEVEVSYSSALNKFTFGLPDNVTVSTNLDVGSALTVGGNISATGNISAAGLTATGANITFADNLIEFGVNNTDLEDIGFYGQRGDGIGGSNGFAGFAWDESTSQFIAFTSSGEPTTTVGTNTKADMEIGALTTSEVDCAGAVAGQIRLEGSAPSTSSDTGTAGDMRFDSGFLYICTATNTWKRVALSTF
jgi:hypothetical protein